MKLPVNLSKEIAEVTEVLIEEIKMPLTSISFNLQSIKRMLNNEEEFSKEQLLEKTSLIETKINQMTHVIDEMIDLAKSQFLDLKMKINLTNTHDLIVDIIDKSRAFMSNRTVKLEHQNSSDYCTVACDRDRMVQAVSDIIGSIVSNDNRPKTVKLSSKTNGEVAQLKIIDEESTIDKSYLNKVFEAFWRSGIKSKEKVGLGLALAKSIIEANHGKIWVESKAGLGTVFFIELPKMDLSEFKARMA